MHYEDIPESFYQGIGDLLLFYVGDLLLFCYLARKMWLYLVFKLTGFPYETNIIFGLRIDWYSSWHQSKLDMWESFVKLEPIYYTTISMACSCSFVCIVCFHQPTQGSI